MSAAHISDGCSNLRKRWQLKRRALDPCMNPPDEQDRAHVDTINSLTHSETCVLDESGDPLIRLKDLLDRDDANALVPSGTFDRRRSEHLLTFNSCPRGSEPRLGKARQMVL